MIRSGRPTQGWELNDLARRLDRWLAAVELCEGLVPAAPAGSASVLSPDGLQVVVERPADLRPGEEPPESVHVHAGRKWVF
jgi:hypothetical protein